MSKNCEVIIYLLDNYIRYGTKLYKQIVGIPIETNCIPPVADFLLLLFIFYLIFILFFFFHFYLFIFFLLWERFHVISL